MATAYLTFQINSSSFPSFDGGATDATKPEEALQRIIYYLQSIQSTKSGTVTVSSSTVAGTISGQTGGVGPTTFNLS